MVLQTKYEQITTILRENETKQHLCECCETLRQLSHYCHTSVNKTKRQSCEPCDRYSTMSHDYHTSIS